MKILFDIHDNDLFFADIKAKRSKIIESYYKDKLMNIKKEKSNSAFTSEYDSLEGNKEILKFLIKNKFNGWIKISEENDFLCIFSKRINSAIYYEYKKATDRKST